MTNQGFLAGKVAVVTGGARGIGAATAEALVRSGARVVVGDVDTEAAAATAVRLGAAVTSDRLDVTDASAFAGFLDAVEQSVGPLDILVNNAGIQPLSLLTDESDAMTRRTLEVNLHGVINGTREAARRMSGRGIGHIVNLASGAGKAGFPGGATYCATKHGVVGLSEAVRAELRGTGVHVTVVLPAIVRTEMSDGLTYTRGVRSLGPEEVADTVITALRKPRFEVYVPRSAGATVWLGALLPRGARDRVMHWLRADRMLLDAIGSAERQTYNSRTIRQQHDD